MSAPVVVRSFTQRSEAEIARGVLEAEGIDASIMADDLGSEGPGITFGKAINLVVDAEHAERARELLDQAIEEGEAAAEDEAES